MVITGVKGATASWLAGWMHAHLENFRPVTAKIGGRGRIEPAARSEFSRSVGGVADGRKHPPLDLAPAAMRTLFFFLVVIAALCHVAVCDKQPGAPGKKEGFDLRATVQSAIDFLQDPNSSAFFRVQFLMKVSLFNQKLCNPFV